MVVTSSSSIAHKAVPARFGRYETLAHIASGGMGSVYVCRLAGRDGFERLFAVKFVHAHLAEEAEFVKMLHQEARIAARAHHPNIVGIVDVGDHEGVPYVVMDYVEGCTFGDLLRMNQENRPIGSIIAIIVDALKGLDAAHSLTDTQGKPLGLVHRDVSPHNLLVGVDGSCRIADFGVAKATNALQQTLPGKMKGKPAYMSPEQVAGEAVDRRSDIFSLGVVMWNALTGRGLFEGNSQPATMYNVLRREIPPPSRIGQHPPAWLDAICLKALERDPDKRYQNAQDFLADLRRQAIGRDLLAPTSDVASWVRGTFGSAFETRRQIIRQGPSRTQVQRVDATEVNKGALGELGTLVSEGSQTEVEGLRWDELNGAADASTVKGDGSSQLSHAELSASRQSRLRAPLLMLGSAAVAAVVVALLLRQDPASEEAVDKPAPAAAGVAEDEGPAGSAGSRGQAKGSAPSEPNVPSVAQPASDPPAADDSAEDVVIDDDEEATPPPPEPDPVPKKKKRRKTKAKAAPPKPAPEPQPAPKKKKPSALDRNAVDANPYMAD